MTEEELQRLIAQHGGEVGGAGAGRRVDPRSATMTVTPYPDAPSYTVDVDNPNKTWLIETNSGRTIKVQPQPDGTYVPVDVPAAPAAPRGTEGGAPIIMGGQRFDAGTNTFVDIPGYRGPASAQGSWQNGVFYGPPGADIPEALTANPIALQQAQAQEQRLADAERRLAQQATESQRQAALKAQMDAIELAMKAGEIDAKRAQELRDYLYKTQVEFPAKLREQEDVLRGNAITRGQTAGAAAVSDITATLPYRYSPGFQARQQAVQAEAARGNFQPGITQSIARSYRGPDLAGARQAAESRYENDYLQRFGFDPVATAQGVPYRMPGPTAAPIAGIADDEEELKRFAAQLAGT